MTPTEDLEAALAKIAEFEERVRDKSLEDQGAEALIEIGRQLILLNSAIRELARTAQDFVDAR